MEIWRISVTWPIGTLVSFYGNLEDFSYVANRDIR